MSALWDEWYDPTFRDELEDREIAWEADPDYDDLMERDEDEVVGEEEPDEWSVWLEAGWRSIPNRGGG